jgi:hypothetical protein
MPPTEETFLTGIHRGLADIRHQSLRNIVGNRCMSVPVTALEADDKNDVQTTNAIVYSIGGLNYSAAALADENVTAEVYWGETDIQAADTTCWYALTIDAAGAVKGYKGKDDEILALPAHAADECCFAILKVVTVGVTFQMGTDDYDKAGVTATFTDVSFLPADPP